MKFEAEVSIKYPKKKLFKRFFVNRVLDKTHARKVLKDNLKKLYPGKSYLVLNLNEIE